jgi:GNAT superfamily N-acetyltransferase
VPLLRVCQAASLPPYRGHGHGSRLLQAVYDYAKTEVGASEVTVEDPNDAFRLLRDLVDYRNCVRLGLMAPTSMSAPPTADALGAARDALRVTDEQLTRCHELRQYAQLRGANEETTKPWRLAVKRRLLKLHKEELDALLSVQAKEEADTAKEVAAGAGAGAGGEREGPSRDDLVALRKARLDELYRELTCEYDAVLERAGDGAK